MEFSRTNPGERDCSCHGVSQEGHCLRRTVVLHIHSTPKICAFLFWTTIMIFHSFFTLAPCSRHV
ncbi:hypothetical protein BDV36DRAFT_251032 [Aspergillus pseudocaelatus]|uniref:Copper-fist domain-containing protein n=1 Tax=Aspergillus pseudocaelatus TaxID=1825620 RepID=A0ABQ6WRE5_9EURO|nr:hypothetical protein BDV36DRAFT_251032 [Aspergillus pseudocaelatus]